MSPHKLQNEHIKEIQIINYKNEPNSSIKFGFQQVTLGEHVANGLATKRSLNMHFEVCEGCAVGVCDQNGKMWPPTEKTLQIAQKSNMEAQISSVTLTKA